MYTQKQDSRPDLALSETELGMYSYLIGPKTILVHRKTNGIVTFYDNWKQASNADPLIAVGTHPEYVGYDLSKTAPMIPDYDAKQPMQIEEIPRKGNVIIVGGSILDFLTREDTRKTSTSLDHKVI